MPVETIVGLPMALVLGLVYGLGPCLVSCLPYLGPVFLARDFSLRRSWRVVLPLSLGRLAGYSLFGAAAGWAGRYVKDSAAASPQLHLLFGAAALMVGLALFWQRRPACAVAAAPAADGLPLRRFDLGTEPRPLLPGGLFLMGAGMALTPCGPLGVVLFSAAASGHAAGGFLLGLGFGLGAIVVPSLVYGLGVAYFGARLREQLGPWRPRIEALSAGLLILVGMSQLIRAF
ncbi:sulfite exporter TauE/SafE family protein [Sulfuricella sp.]|uniref:urease accessory protein UreH domain-containing protein n=1 Tax=Sulfuricella sp. TaxID=2099377 RepID=UPI002C3F8F4C|nr:sulfite exporter TauE/SafE family protein [Sulfuricella sp.]HUX62583.1 sulfite exporter TauE/SafE family protein [Sulfuricella sp.]